MRRHQGDDHEGSEADPRDRGGARRGRACGGGWGLRQDETAPLFERVADSYDRVAFPFFTRFGEALVEFAQIGSDERVLDVGCGAGAALAPAAQRAASAVGVELSPAMAERARVAAPSAEVLVGDAAALDLPDRSFDVVVSAFVVFFMPDPTAALREWRRLLRPGGRLVIATWGRADPRWSWERELRMEFAGEMNPETLQELRNGIGLLTRFEEPTKVEEELRAASFMPDLVTPHVIDFVFGGPDAWWEWNWSHGARMFLERLSADAQERFREKAYTAMQVSRDGHGFPRTYTALFSRAVATADR